MQNVIKYKQNVYAYCSLLICCTYSKLYTTSPQKIEPVDFMHTMGMCFIMVMVFWCAYVVGVRTWHITLTVIIQCCEKNSRKTLTNIIVIRVVIRR